MCVSLPTLGVQSEAAPAPTPLIDEEPEEEEPDKEGSANEQAELIQSLLAKRDALLRMQHIRDKVRKQATQKRPIDPATGCA